MLIVPTQEFVLNKYLKDALGTYRFFKVIQLEKNNPPFLSNQFILGIDHKMAEGKIYKNEPNR